MSLFNLAVVDEILAQLYPRLIGHIDRDIDSPTFGSCNRHYWLYRLQDFESGVLQQCSLALAYLSQAERDEQQANYLRELACAINRRTLWLIRRGWLDEYYPGERSYPATAFGAYALLKSAQLLGQSEVVHDRRMHMVADWLMAQSAPAAANQRVAAAAYLMLLKQVSAWRAQEIESHVEHLILGDDRKGLLLEYGGGDLGYLTVSLNYLAYMFDDKWEERHRFEDVFRASVRCVADFVTPAGQLGGEFSSRSTTYFLPFGCVVGAAWEPEAFPRLARLDLKACVRKLDDRYLLHYFWPSLARTAWWLRHRERERRSESESGPEKTDNNWRVRSHESRGLVTCEKRNAWVGIGLAKGLSFNIELNGKTFIDNGYRLEEGGKIYASSVVDPTASFSMRISDSMLEAQSVVQFLCYRDLTASPSKTILLRLLSPFGHFLSRLFKRWLISKPLQLEGARLHRRIKVDFVTSMLEVEDHLENGGRLPAIAPPVSLRLVPSARFYQDGEEEATGRAGTRQGSFRISLDDSAASPHLELSNNRRSDDP